MFSRKHTPEVTGVLLFEHLRREVSGDGILSMDRLRESLLERMPVVADQFEGEVMIGCMFAAVLAIEDTCHPPMRGAVRRGMEEEFLRHLREQGATDEQREEWLVVVGDHFTEYFRSIESQTDPALPTALGREFLWNATGVEEHDPGLAETSTVYLTSARAVARQLLRQQLPLRSS
jgi:hypothetical protein